MKLRECFRRSNNNRRVCDGGEKTAKRSDEVGAGDNVASAAVATVDKDVKSKDALSFVVLCQLFKSTYRLTRVLVIIILNDTVL